MIPIQYVISILIVFGGVFLDCYVSDYIPICSIFAIILACLLFWIVVIVSIIRAIMSAIYGRNEKETRE